MKLKKLNKSLMNPAASLAVRKAKREIIRILGEDLKNDIPNKPRAIICSRLEFQKTSDGIGSDTFISMAGSTIQLFAAIRFVFAGIAEQQGMSLSEVMVEFTKFLMTVDLQDITEDDE